MRLNIVVLPAPFGPIRLTSSPFGDLEIERVDGGEAAEAARQARALRSKRRHLTPSPTGPCGRKRTSSSSTTP